jgi:Protein of unknown function (DUF3307)
VEAGMPLIQWLPDLKIYTKNKQYMVLFTYEQGNLLVRLLLAHILSDFLLQTDSMVKSKRWFSSSMLAHIGIVFLSTYLLSGCWLLLSIGIAITHWLIDSIKMELQKRVYKELTLFIIDQAMHILVIIYFWAFHFQLFSAVFNAIKTPLLNYKTSIILFVYAIIIWPVGFLIGFATKNLIQQNNESNIGSGGKIIGQFERIIILTFVLLNQYEAIGFLITGKSIIRFAGHDENLRSEYVLVGTMMSYAISILIGVLTNWLLSM